MKSSKKKIQIVVVALTPSPHLLRLKTNEKRGGFWQNITGSVEAGENFAQAALRELHEETSINLDGVPHWKLIQLDYEICFTDRLQRLVREQSFALLLNDPLWKNPPTITIDPQEHQHWEWKPLPHISAADFYHPTNFEAFVRTRLHVTC